MLKTKIRTVVIALGALVVSGAAFAQDTYSVTVDETYDDMMFAVESAILDRGLNIDSVSHVGDMLERTGADLGETEVLFNGAAVFNFCSATFSREAMRIDRANIRYCPYGIFVYTDSRNPDQTIIGHQVYPGAGMAAVNTMLDEIIADASSY